jgi:phosphate/sulfate permease
MTVFIVVLLCIAVIITGVQLSKREENVPQIGRPMLARLIVYWVATFAVAFELSAGAVWDLCGLNTFE